MNRIVRAAIFEVIWIALGAVLSVSLGRALGEFDPPQILTVMIVFWVFWVTFLVAISLSLAFGLKPSEWGKAAEIASSIFLDRKLSLPVSVDQKLDVDIAGPIEIPIELKADVELLEDIEIEATVPVKARVPLNADIETDIFKIGVVSLPIRAEIPIDFELPLKTRVRVVGGKLPVKIKEEASVNLPTMTVPVSDTLNANLDMNSKD